MITGRRRDKRWQQLIIVQIRYIKITEKASPIGDLFLIPLHSAPAEGTLAAATHTSAIRRLMHPHLLLFLSL